MNYKSDIISFVNEVENYQSNHMGYYDRNELLITYKKLPNEVKKYLTTSKKVLNNLWRGADGLSEHRAISFTNNKSYASIFGVYVIPFLELKSYSATISTERLLNLCNRMKLKSNVGDDEGEVIVINPIWKEDLDLSKYKEKL